MLVKGIAAAPGIAIGKAYVWESGGWPLAANVVETAEPENELRKLNEAVMLAENDLDRLREMTEKELGPEQAGIFAAHLAFLSDPMFVGEIRRIVSTKKITAESAVGKVAASLIEMFRAIDDEYLRERALDVKDVSQKLIGMLNGVSAGGLSSLAGPAILIAHDIAPSDAAQFPPGVVLGMAMAAGGKTSHSAILARARNIPAAVGLGAALFDLVKPGDLLILDGTAGELIIAPDDEVLRRYQKRQAKEAERAKQLEQLRELPAVTQDGFVAELAVNIGKPDEVPDGIEKGAQGVGLFRTEYLYMDREQFPTEEEQAEAYRQAAELAQGRPVVIRTLDIGGDKRLTYFALPQEANPFLGWRALRIGLEKTELLLTQIKAVLRASAFGKIRLMLPMVSHVEQIQAAKRLIAQAKSELFAAGVPFDDNLEVGVMIEIPAAAIIAEQLAQEADFFSIGTNDLVQYTLAVDRMNEKVAPLCDYFHPAVLRLIDLIIRASERSGIRASMCGEMAGDPLAAPLLVGLGLKEWSMSANAIPQVKEAIRRTNRERAKRLAAQILRMATAEEVRSALREFAGAAE
ncbi:MAG TPA: phosphoenolpyruvate--protein phosphotransferase [Bacilli bacterium]